MRHARPPMPSTADACVVAATVAASDYAEIMGFIFRRGRHAAFRSLPTQFREKQPYSPSDNSRAKEGGMLDRRRPAVPALAIFSAM